MDLTISRERTSEYAALTDESRILQVLIVDDDLDDAALIEELLMAADLAVSVDIVHTVADADTAILSGEYDAYLVDYRLGERNGIELIELAKDYATGPFVLLTGMAEDGIDELALAAGAADYLEKSALTARALRRSLRYAIGIWASTRESERERERFSSLFEGVPVGLFRVNADGRIAEVNQRLVDLLGYPDRSALIGEDALSLHAEPAYRASDITALKAGHETEVRLRRVNGTSIWATVSIDPVVDEEGQVIHYDGAILDTTRRHEAERELSVAGSIIDQAPVGVIQTDLDGVVTTWNHQAEVMYGWTADEAIGHPIGDLTVPEGDNEGAKQIMASILANGAWRGEFLARHKDRSDVPIYVLHSLIYDERSEPTGVVGMSQDLSDLKQAHTILARRVDQQAALAKLSRLAVDTHDVDTFLAASANVVATTLELDSVEILEMDPAEESFVVRVSRHGDDRPATRVSAVGSLAGLAFSTRTSVVVEDVEADDRVSTDPCVAGSRSCVASPIGNGDPWGALTVHSRIASRFDHDDVYFVESAGNLIAAVIDRARGDQHRNRLAEILETTTDFVGTADANGRVTYANRAARAAAGFDELDDIVGLGIDAFQPQWAVDLITSEAIPIALNEGVWSGRTAFFDPVKGEIPTSQLIIAHEPPGDGDAFLSTVARDLTETLDAERQLGESQALVGKAFHDATMGKAVLDLEGRYITVNRALTLFLGCEPEDLVGRSFREFTHPEDVEIGQEEIERMRSGDLDSFNVQKRYVRGDGATVWGLLHVSHMSGDSGHPGYQFAQVVDIDSQKQAEEQIRFQASLLDQVHNAVIATDLEGRIISWNRFAVTMFGWTAEEAIGQELFSLIAPDADDGELTAMLVQALLAEGKWEGEGTLARRDGTRFPAYMSDSLLTDDEGDPIGVVGVKIDLSETKKAQAVAHRQGEIAQSVLRSVRFPVAVLDGRGVITAVNQTWSRFSEENGGDPSATGMGADYLEACHLAGDDSYAMAAREGIQQVLAGGIEEFTMNYPCPEADGTERWFELEVTPIEDEGAVVTHWDITDELNARSALEETIRAKDQFIATLSHELRTPLTAIVGLTQLMKEGNYGKDEASEFQETIAEQAQEVALLVEDLLVAARLDSDTLTFKPERLNLVSEIDRVLAPWRTQRLVDIEVRSPESVVVATDPVRLRQIIRNLVTNAIRHGEEPFEIEISRHRASISVTVADHGLGVPEHALDMMFQPYAAFANESGQPSSVGLGLHVSRGLAKRMGGDLTYWHEAGRTVFELQLPARGH